MADSTLKNPENIDGKYYVDQNCIAAKLCASLAPGNFKMGESGTYAIVYRQPANDSEVAQCEEARRNCPVAAIGDDGQ